MINRTVRALGAGVVLLLLVAAPPTLLVLYVGNPWPAEGVDLAAPLTDGALIGLLAVIAWLLWLQLVVCVLLEAHAAVIGRAETVRIRFAFGFQQQLARRLVTAIVVAAIATPVVGAVLNAAAAAPTAPRRSSTPTRADRPGPVLPVEGAASSSAAGHVQKQSGRETRETAAQQETAEWTVRVHRGDTLWAIAEKHLGSGERWPEIADANEGTDMGAGTVFRSADLIQPGWELRLPGAAPANADDTSYIVKSGDTLSQIAQDQLGDTDAYPRIFEASRDVVQPGGHHLTDPDMIEPGWRVQIPGSNQPPPGEPSTETAPERHTDKHSPPGRSGRKHPQERERGLVDVDDLAPMMRIGAATGLGAGRSDRGTEASGGASSDDGSRADATVDGHNDESPAWMLPGLAGAGSVLALSLGLALRNRRRTQFRSRRPGRRMPPPPSELVRVERSIMLAPVVNRSAASAEFMDAALRRLATVRAAAGEQMPTVAAVELTGDQVVLHLSSPIALAAPWNGDGEQLRWSLSTDTAAPAEETPGEAPYPLLVTVGATVPGDVWLLNMEVMGTVSVTGDRERREAFARYVAAEVAVNAWSTHARVDCVAMCAGLEKLNPVRIRYYRSVVAAAQTSREALADARATVERVQTHQVPDTATGRAGAVAEDTWTARMLIIDALAAHEVANGDAKGTGVVSELLDLVAANPGRTSTAVFLADQASEPTQAAAAHKAVRVELDEDGALRLPDIGLEVIAVGLSTVEADGIGALLAHCEDVDNVEVPAEPTATTGWRAWADEAGALRQEHTHPRDVAGNNADEESAGSLLEDTDEHYLAAAATTAQELHDLAPRVDQQVRASVEDSDPTLDADVAAWWSEDCDLPRLTVLGPVKARTRGNAAVSAGRRPYYTELLAYLVAHPHGSDWPHIAEDMGIARAAVRNGVGVLREWLGVNPRTGDKHVPEATKTRAAKARGGAFYQVDDILVDADLFRRLRVRGIARGVDGTEDLLAALRLVSGQPFSKTRDEGWGWLTEGERLDQVMLNAIVDVAHTLTTKALADEDLTLARAAAEIAVLAAPYEESARLNLAKVTAAEGHTREAEAMLKTQVFNRTEDDQPPVELSHRTQEVLANWRAG